MRLTRLVLGLGTEYLHLYLRAAYNQSPMAKRINSEVATTLCFLTFDKRDTVGGKKRVFLMERVYLARLLHLALHEWVVGLY